MFNYLNAGLFFMSFLLYLKITKKKTYLKNLSGLTSVDPVKA